MKSASILIKPASANCNMDCKYCFYKCLSQNREEFSKGFMTEETLEKLVSHAFAYVEESITFAFQGGEPTLAGLDFYKKLMELQSRYNKNHISIENTIQTNGIALDEDFAKFLKKHHFLVGLSLDGPKKIHDSFRTDTKEAPTFDSVITAAGLLDKYAVPYNILTVITDSSAKKAAYLYKFYKRNHFPYIQFIPCMDEPNRGNSGSYSEYAVTSENYGKFLCELFDLWYADFAAGDRMDIRMFSNLAQMAAGYPAEECGMNGCCSVYFVVEGDGSVYPCDFYCMDEYKLGTVDDSFQHMITSEKAENFVAASLEPNAKCRNCKYFKYCRGGCRRWREKNTGQIGLNALCPAYELFFEHAADRIEALGRYILKNVLS